MRLENLLDDMGKVLQRGPHLSTSLSFWGLQPIVKNPKKHRLSQKKLQRLNKYHIVLKAVFVKVLHGILPHIFETIHLGLATYLAKPFTSIAI